MTHDNTGARGERLHIPSPKRPIRTYLGPCSIRIPGCMGQDLECQSILFRHSLKISRYKWINIYIYIIKTNINGNRHVHIYIDIMCVCDFMCIFHKPGWKCSKSYVCPTVLPLGMEGQCGHGSFRTFGFGVSFKSLSSKYSWTHAADKPYPTSLTMPKSQYHKYFDREIESPNQR